MAYRAGRRKVPLTFVVLVCCAACASAQQPAPSPAEPNDLLFPFSAALRTPGEREATRLKTLLEQLDDVARAEVVVTRTSDGSPQVLVILGWRAGRPSPVAAAWAAELAPRVIGGLSHRALTVADTSGRVWYGRQVALPAAEAKLASAPTWPALVGGMLAGMVCAGLLVVWWQRRGRWPRRAVEVGQVALSPRRVSKILHRSSPAVRGALLAGLSPEAQRAVSARLRKGVDLPARAPDPEILSVILAALDAKSEEKGR